MSESFVSTASALGHLGLRGERCYWENEKRVKEFKGMAAKTGFFFFLPRATEARGGKPLFRERGDGRSSEKFPNTGSGRYSREGE